MAQGERVRVLGGAEFLDPLRVAHAETAGAVRAMACSGCTGSGEIIQCNDCGVRVHRECVDIRGQCKVRVCSECGEEHDHGDSNQEPPSLVDSDAGGAEPPVPISAQTADATGIGPVGRCR